MTLRTGALALATIVLLASPPLSAHFSLDQGTTHKSRHGDQDIKAGPCGRADGTRGTNVYVYRPGEAIRVEIIEYIGHPGYFRIAFDDDGDDAFADPQTVAPINRECMDIPEDHCGEPDFYNNDAVLLDNLDPHVPQNIFEARTYSWDVTLPSVTCDNCTLQVIQVMTDAPGIHAPYDPNSPTADDIYYQCIDLVLAGEPVVTDSGTVSRPGGGPATDDGAGGTGSADEHAKTRSGDGGCTIGRREAPRHGEALMGSLALAWLMRRTRRAVGCLRP
jgi:hypothetical protein